MKTFFYIIVLFSCFILKAQTIDPAFLTNIPNASQAEIDAYDPINLEIGMLVYNTDENRIFEYTNTGFIEFLLGPNIFVGQFTITATGNQIIGGLPFRPSHITFAAQANITGVTLNGDSAAAGNNSNNADNTFGSMSGYARDGSPIVQQVIFSGGSGNSINNVSRFAANNRCIAIRFTNQNGGNLGRTDAILNQFRDDGFRIRVTNLTEDLVVFYTAYR